MGFKDLSGSLKISIEAPYVHPEAFTDKSEEPLAFINEMWENIFSEVALNRCGKVENLRL